MDSRFSVLKFELLENEKLLKSEKRQSMLAVQKLFFIVKNSEL